MADEAAVRISGEESDRKESIANESLEHINEKESPDDHNQGDNGNAESEPKDWKVWSEHETKCLIDLYKSCVLEYPEYSRKLLWQEISLGLKKFGYNKNPERVRNRMKSLRTAYRRVVDYNSKHILKKDFPYLEDLDGVYNITSLSDDNDNSSNSPYGSVVGEETDNYSVAKPNYTSKKLRLVRTTKTVRPEVGGMVKLASKNMNSRSAGNRPTMKKKPPSKKTIFPLFQCGQCLGKFSTSQEMHSHNCQGKGQVSQPQVNGNKKVPALKKRNGAPAPSNKTPFEILLKPTGNAPILQKKRWTVPATYKIADVVQFIRKFMKFDSSNSLFLYVNQAFAPCPDDEIGNVYRCFNMNGRLVLHYSTSVAWG